MSFICFFFFLNTPGLVNTDIIPAIDSLFQGKDMFIAKVITGFPGAFLLVMALILVLDFGTNLYKAMKYDR